MEKSIRILDYIEEHEVELMKDFEVLKTQVFGGLEELANYRLTQEAEASVAGIVGSAAETYINEQLELVEGYRVSVNPYLARARSRFLSTIHTALKISKVKLGLKSILSSDD